VRDEGSWWWSGCQCRTGLLATPQLMRTPGARLRPVHHDVLCGLPDKGVCPRLWKDIRIGTGDRLGTGVLDWRDSFWHILVASRDRAPGRASLISAILGLYAWHGAHFFFSWPALGSKEGPRCGSRSAPSALSRALAAALLPCSAFSHNWSPSDSPLGWGTSPIATAAAFSQGPTLADNPLRGSSRHRMARESRPKWSGMRSARICW